MHKEMYAISYYGDKYVRGYVEMDFLDCEGVNEYLRSSTQIFWNRMHIIAADVPYHIYKDTIKEKKKSLSQDGILYKVIIEDVKNGKGFLGYEIFPNGEEKTARYRIVSAKKCSEEETMTIRNGLLEKYDINYYPNYRDELLIERWRFILHRKFLFKVHNVGQGLATSLEDADRILFYFDYGTGTNRNTFTVPSPSPGLEVDVNSTIIFLSHADEDHWCGYRINSDSLKCVWVVPSQRGRALYNSLLARIISSGGRVYRHDVNIDFGWLHIGKSESTIRTTRMPTKVHETGFALYLEGQCEEDETKPLKIVVSGDQDYDYQNPSNYQYSDVLVASHHGGKYCWSSLFSGIFPRGDNSTIVYSYGAGNTYHHPSKDHDYTGWGWKRRHDTATDGCYEITILL